MSWISNWIPGFFMPSLAWLFALLVPIIIFYFLKLRRTRIQVSSLALWQQVIQDQRVNAPFQKFKRNLLLWLQLLLLCLVVLAAMQPYWKGDAARMTYLPILIDVSASMGGVDANGVSRLDLVKQELRPIIDGLLPDQRLTLIAVGNSARRLTEFTDNQQLLQAALNRLTVQDVPSQIEDGLLLAQALARTQEIPVVRLYSDGNLPTKPNPATGKPMAAVNFDLPFQVDFFQIDLPGNNLGITALNARRSSPETWDVFIRVEGATTGSTEGMVTLTANGQPIGEEQIVVGPGEAQRLVFRVDARTHQELEATLKPVGLDALAADNRAWLSLPKGRNLNVYCEPELRTYRHALAAMSGVDLFPDDAGNDTPGAYDLVITESTSNLTQSAAVSLLVGAIPAELQGLLSIRDEPTEVVDWVRNAQILQHVQMKDVIISQTPVRGEGVENLQFEELGYQILVHGRQGPLLLSRREANRVHYVWPFHTDRSTLPYRIGFPVMLSNLVDEALQRSSLAELRGPATGVLPVLELQAEQTYRVTTPDGQIQTRRTDAGGLLRGISAPHVGQYEIRDGGELVAQLGVGLLNATETRLETVDTITFNELSVTAAEDRLQADQPLWTWLAGIALCVLLFEWWYFHKRPAGIPDV